MSIISLLLFAGIATAEPRLQYPHDSVYSDAYTLAQHHFDPDHKVGIKYLGNEMQFALQALELCRSAVPSIRDIHIAIGVDAGRSLGLLPHSSLCLYTPSPGGGRVDAVDSMATSLVRDLGVGCAPISPASAEGGAERAQYWEICDLRESDETVPRCVDNERAEWLCSQGVRWISRSWPPWPWSRPEAYLYFDEPQDLVNRAGQMMGDSRFAELFPNCGIGVIHCVPAWGGEPELALIDEPRADPYQQIGFRFTIESGEGVPRASRRGWKLVVSNAGGANAGTWKLSITTLEAFGAPENSEDPVDAASRFDLRKLDNGN